MIHTANPPQGSKPQTTSAHLRSGKFIGDKNLSAKDPTRPATARTAKSAAESGPARKKRPTSATTADTKSGTAARNAEHAGLGGMLVAGVGMSQQLSGGGNPSEARIGNELMKMLEERAAARGISGADVNVARNREAAASTEQHTHKPSTAGSFRFEESGPSQTLREAVRKYAQIQTLQSIYSNVPTKPSAARPKTATGAGALTTKTLLRKDRPMSAVSTEQKGSKATVAETAAPKRQEDAIKAAFGRAESNPRSAVKRNTVVDLAHAQARLHEKSSGSKQYADIVGGKRATIAELIARCVYFRHFVTTYA
jgi:hypothetical protein